MSAAVKSSRHLRAERFKDEPFWQKDFVPTLHAMIAGCTAELRTCPLDQVEGVRAQIEVLEKLERFPDMVIKQEADALAFKRAQLEEDDAEPIPAAGQDTP